MATRLDDQALPRFHALDGIGGLDHPADQEPAAACVLIFCLVPACPTAVPMRMTANDRSDQALTRVAQELVSNFEFAKARTMTTAKSTDSTAKPITVPGATEPEDHSIEVLHDGSRVMIRPIHKQDVELERRLIAGLSPASRRSRFLGTMTSPSDELLKQLTDIDSSTDAAYVALIAVGAEKREVGVARFSAGPNGKDGEFAVTVSDEWQHKGLATLLMRHLIAAARARGIESLHSIDAANNDSMRKFAEHMGFQHRRDPNDATQVLYSLDLKT